MNRPLKNRPYLIFFILFLVSITPFSGKFISQSKPSRSSNELYKPELIRLNTIGKFTTYIDSSYKNNSNVFDTAAYVSLASKLTKERFHHGSSDYRFSENWIIYLCGKLFWSHFSSIVLPDDILKYEMGLCSQQTIVFMDVLKHKNIKIRSVGLGYKEGPGHFLCEVKYNGQWHIHDVSLEPVWSNIANDHLSMDYYLTKKDSLFLVYKSRIPRSTFYKLLEKKIYGDINQMPAQNMAMFHRFTFFLIYFIPSLLLFFGVLSYWKKTKKGALSDRLEPQEGNHETMAPVSV